MSNVNERKTSDNELKKKWETGRLDSKSLYIVTPKEIEVCISVPAEIEGKRILAIGSGAFSPRMNPYLSNKKREKLNEINRVILPEGIEAIDDNAFYDEEDGLLSKVTIHAPAGSYAEQYAKENNIPFVAE